MARKGAEEKKQEVWKAGGESAEQTLMTWFAPVPTRASPVAQLVKHPPAMRETWARSLGWEDPLKEAKATHSSILAWRILWSL